MAPFSYARRAILWSNFMVPFNGAILWHVCTRHYSSEEGVVAGHSGQFTPGGYLSTVNHTALAGIEPTTFRLLVRRATIAYCYGETTSATSGEI